MRTRISVAIFAALVGCGSSNNVTCGDGTTLVDGTCELGSGGSGGSGGTGDTCGSGTTLQGTTCVATGGGGDASAPTISMITPPDTGIYGHVAFEIDGTGFAGDNVSSLTVFFGDTTNQDCQAIIGPATSTVIVGEVPVFCALDVQVSVITNLGTTTTPFHYDAIVAGEGNGGGPEGAGGALFLIDPFVGLSEELGYISDANDNPYDFDAMDFDAAGANLYVATSGSSPADTAAQGSGADFASIVLGVDLSTGDTTVLGTAVDAGGDDYLVTDMKLSNGTLYGWAYDVTPTTPTEGLVTISTTNGQITPVGTLAALPDDQTFESAGMTFDGSGVLNVAPSGAAPDEFIGDGATGELDTVAPATGDVTVTATTLDWAPFAGQLFGVTVGATIDSMATFQGSMLAVVDDGNAGLTGATLAIIDPTQTPIVGALFELPAQLGEPSAIDAIAIPPTGSVIAIAANKAAHPTWLQPPARSTQPVKHATRRAHRVKH